MECSDMNAMMARDNESVRPATPVFCVEDQRDIAGSLQGDGEAYARLVRRYQGEIARQMGRFTRDRAVLEELVQEVFVEAYMSLPGYKQKAPFLHWLRRIATRTGYRHWKKTARQWKENVELSDTLADPKVYSEPSEAAEYLYGLLEQLNPADRLVLTLLYFEECDTYEIAERMGWSRTLVKVRAFRARNHLRNLLEQAGFRKEAV